MGFRGVFAGQGVLGAQNTGLRLERTGGIPTTQDLIAAPGAGRRIRVYAVQVAISAFLEADAANATALRGFLSVFDSVNFDDFVWIHATAAAEATQFASGHDSLYVPSMFEGGAVAPEDAAIQAQLTATTGLGANPASRFVVADVTAWYREESV